MQIGELKNTITEINGSMGGFTSQLDAAKQNCMEEHNQNELRKTNKNDIKM